MKYKTHQNFIHVTKHITDQSISSRVENNEAHELTQMLYTAETRTQTQRTIKV